MIESERSEFEKSGREILLRSFGINPDAARIHSSIVFYPEILVSRQVGRAIRFLKGHGFAPLWAGALRFNPELIAEKRRYDARSNSELPRATRAIVELMESSENSVLVLMKHADNTLDASERLSELKGSAFPEDRNATHLRSVLSSRNPVFKMVHTPDDTSSFLVQLGVFASRCPGLFPTSSPYGGDWERCLEATTSQCPRHDLKLPPALSRLRRALLMAERGVPQDVRSALELVADASAGRFVDWMRLFSLVDALQIPVSPWDRITICGHLTKYDWSPDIDEMLTRWGRSGISPRKIHAVLCERGYTGLLSSVEAYVAKHGPAAPV